MARIKAIITDFDGTLVDTMEANVQAYKNACLNFYTAKIAIIIKGRGVKLFCFCWKTLVE